MRFTSFLRLFGEDRPMGKPRVRRRHGAARRRALAPSIARPTLEALEDRTLLSVIPSPTFSNQQDISLLGGEQNSPAIVVDPLNPQHLVSVFVRNDQSITAVQKILIDGVASTNGGTTWPISISFPGNMPNPDDLMNPLPQATNPTVAFDRDGNFYVVYSEHTADNKNGVIVMDKFHLGTTLTTIFLDKILYRWALQNVDNNVGEEAALNPVVVADDSVPSFTDPANPGFTQTDPFANVVGGQTYAPIYVAWNLNEFNGTNPVSVNIIQMIASADGGVNFSSPKIVSSGAFNSAPAIGVSQGTPVPNPVTGQQVVSGGLATVVWDNYSTDANGTDNILTKSIQDGGAGAVFKQNTMHTYQDAMAGMNGNPDTPVTTPFPQTVDFTQFMQYGFNNITGLTVTLNIGDQHIDDVSIDLMRPDGVIYHLLNNRVDEMGRTKPRGADGRFPGIAGPNLGVIQPNPMAPAVEWDSTFYADASIPINDDNAHTPYNGYFRQDSSVPGPSLNSVPTIGQATGTWTLLITDHHNDGMNAMLGFLYDWTLRFTSGLTVPATPAVANTIQTPVGPVVFGLQTRGFRYSGNGQNTDVFPTAPNVLPVPGIGPAPVIASDNTLGAFSSYQGRLYLAFTSIAPVANPKPPADATKIYLATSLDGGKHWIVKTDPTTLLPIPLDDDLDDPLLNPNQVDGFSEGSLQSGRPHFMPQIQVDQYTGTLVASYYDGRYDASRDRVVTTVAASIDGGNTFAPQVWANPTTTVRGNPASTVVLDTVTGAAVTLEPIPDNESSGNSKRDPLFGFGSQMGLAVADGIIHPAWAGNENGGLVLNPPDILPLNIYTAIGRIAAGPRVVSSTMGPVAAVRLGDLIFNNTFTASGLPLVDGFGVTFDRPVSPGSFTAADVQVFYHSTDPNSNLVPIPVSTDPVPVDTNPLVPGESFSFFIKFDQQQSATGTYSYVVLPNVMDGIRWFDANGNLVLGNLMDQNHNAITGQQPTQNSGGDSYGAPTPLNNGPNFLAPYDQNTLPIIVPGPHIVSTSVPGNPATTDNLVLNNTNSFIDVVFDRDMDPTSFTTLTNSVLRMMGPTGPINGPFEIFPNPAGTDPDPSHPRTFRIEFPVQMVDGTYTLTLSPTIRAENGNQLDTNLNAGVDILFQRPTAGTTPVTYVNHTPLTILPNSTVSSTITVPDTYVVQGLTVGNQTTPGLDITFPDDRDVQAWLVAPDGTQIQLFTHVGTQGPLFNDFSGTVLDDAAITPIQQGHAPFNGIFNPQQPLSVLKGHLVAGVYRLFIENDGSNTGTLQDWSLVFQKAVSQTGLGEPVADQATVSFRLFVDGKNLPQAHQAWTAVGPASINNGLDSGRIGGLALDPSDPSGNTVYAAGASGGVWKTTNFLTNNPQGPTWIPLTDLGPTFGINIGGLAVFGRNNDPKQSMIFAATGEGDTLSPAAAASPFGFTDFGDGFIRSEDGGATWTLLDSTDNTLPYTQRDHKFRGTSAFKVVVDPSPSPFAPNQAVVYGVLSGPNGGIWKSFDSGDHWTLMKAGQATDLVLVPTTQDPAQGNTLRWVYAAFQGGADGGVWFSDSGGSGWTQLLGGVGDPTLVDPSFIPPRPIPVNAPAGTPNGDKGRIVLAIPAATGNPAEDLSYQGWIYAYVSTKSGTTDGLYVTKDRGQNWTKVQINIAPEFGGTILEVPTNDNSRPQADILGAGTMTEGSQGNYDISLTVDPNNPNLVYLGGTADAFPPGYTEIQVDTTGIADPHSVFGYDEFLNDGGQTIKNTTSQAPATLKSPPIRPYGYLQGIFVSPYLNLFRDPLAPFTSASTLSVVNVMNFNNSGIRGPLAPWRPIFPFGSTDQHRVISMIDPLTGRTRLILGDDQGIFSLVPDPMTGQFGTGSTADQVGTAALGTGSRNGNIQITQFYGGAAQPSQNAANQAGVSGFFYGSAQDDGYPASDKNVLQNGNIGWTGPGGDSQWVGTDQAKNLPGTSYLGSVYHYVWPCCNAYTNTIGQGSFVLVNNIPHVQGLLQAPNDPQWPFAGGFNMAVNPIDGNDLVISSGAGRVFRTNNQGLFWTPIGEPSVLDGSNAFALAYGAPDPNDPTHQLDDFIYAGTVNGNIFVTFNAGGSWTKFGTAQGLDGFSVQAISANPRRGSHEAYAVTLGGVFYCPDTSAAGARWQNITNSLFLNSHNIFGDSSMPEQLTYFLTALAVDWRFQIPDDPANPNGPKHPMLYVGGQGGVFRSSDKGQTWTVFPSVGTDGAQANGGYLPDVRITHLDLSLGEIDPNTGLPDPSGGEDLLLATTYGRGEFMIRVPNPQPIEQVFVQGLDNQVYTEKINTSGQPVGTYNLTTVGQVQQEVVGYTAFNLPEVFVIGLDGQVYYQKFDANGNSTTPYLFTTTGQVQSIAVGSDANGSPEVFALGLDNQVYSLKFNGQGDFVGGYNFTTAGMVKSFAVGHDAFNRPEVFVLGEDNQVYYQKFDTNGNSTTPYLFVDTGQVNTLTVGQTANGAPEVFAIGLDNQVYAHHFTTAGDSDHLGYFRAFFRPGDPQGTLYMVKAITVGHDANNNPELFATGLDNNIYAERFDASGNPDPVGFFIAAIGQVGQISIGYDSNNDPELFAIGLDANVYYVTFDATGRPTSPYNLLTPGRVVAVTATP